MPTLQFRDDRAARAGRKPLSATLAKLGVRRRARKVVEVTHRWVAFVVGIALLLVVLSGVVLTWGPELHELLNRDKYAGTETEQPISYEQALGAAETIPGFKPIEAVRDGDVYSVYNESYYAQAHVDAGTGEVLGVSRYDVGFMGLMRNLHFCALSCKSYPGYVGFLDDRVEKSFVPTFGNDELTWGGAILALTGLVLVFLCIGGIWLWWPSIKRFSRGFKIRRSSNYKLNYDLHKVVGIAAIPFLLMWGVTSAGFELKQVPDVWYALTPGDAPAESEFDVLESKPTPGEVYEPEARDGVVTSAEAQAIGGRIAGDDAKQVSIIPAAGKTGSHAMYFADGSDPYEYGNFPGDLGISVDRYSGRSAVTFPANTDAPIGEELWEEWNYSVHSGFFANPGWRIFWGVFGLAVLLLAVTSVITWLIRRRTRKRKGKKAGGELAAEAAD